MQFRDLKKQYQELKPQIDTQIQHVLNSSNFISGSQVNELEQKLAKYVGVKHCITCGNGTDAISLALMAWGIGKGDAVFVPDFTFFASGECPVLCGATVIFVDVDHRTYNMDAEKLQIAIDNVKREGKLKCKAVIAVDLFGLPADYHRISNICKMHQLLLLEDAAQGFGGEINGTKACSFGDIATTSFFPAKPLGCYGDGGAIFTDNDQWAELIRSYCVHGKNREDKYDNIRIGINSRLDTIQAAVLLTKLSAFSDYELEYVNKVAKWYLEELKDSYLILPYIPDGYTSSWAQFTVQLKREINRDTVQETLRMHDIPTMIYYKKPMHKQGAFNGDNSRFYDCSVTNLLCETVMSLPMHPYLSQEEVCYIANTLKNAIK